MMNNEAGALKLVVLSALLFFIGFAGAQARPSDNGDGTYSNPVIYADYPDPDIIRVGEDFYFVSTTFVNVPGINVLHSKDLVNWEIAGHVVQRLEGREQYDLKNGTAYRSGLFAANLRHYKGTFYVAVTPVSLKTRIYYTKDIRGTWQFHELDREAFDPALFIDTDGTGYIATSIGSDGHIKLLKLNEDYSKIVDSKEIHYIKGAEGSHIVKRADWYYLFNAIPGRMSMTVSRAKNLYGPWETKEQLSDRTGGHQGAIVDLPDGTFYGFVMKDYPAIGRMTNISPIFWQDDWPVWGTPEAPGRVPERARKPIQGKPVVQPPTSDGFTEAKLGLQWQWNHNPDDTRWSLTERPGFLRLKPTQSAGFWTARNTLTQKGQGPWSRGEVKMDLSGLKPGDVCGFGTLGKYSGYIAVNCGADGKRFLSMSVINDTGRATNQVDTRVASQPLEAQEIFLRLDMDFNTAKGLCSYSTDGKTWTSLGGEFRLAYEWRTGTFQGPQYAIFCYNPNPGEGFVDVDSFRFDDRK